MSKAMLNPELAAMVPNGVEQAHHGAMPLADKVMSLPASNYADTQRFKREVERIFHWVRRAPRRPVPAPAVWEFRPRPGS